MYIYVYVCTYVLYITYIYIIYYIYINIYIYIYISEAFISKFFPRNPPWIPRNIKI